METINNREEDQVFCVRQDKNVSKESCRRCDAYLADDIYSLFSRCVEQRDRFEALYKLYKRKSGKTS